MSYMPCVSYALVKYYHGTVNMRLLRCMHTILTTVDEHIHVVNVRKAV